jgi:hypothetical protein
VSRSQRVLCSHTHYHHRQQHQHCCRCHQ